MSIRVMQTSARKSYLESFCKTHSCSWHGILSWHKRNEHDWNAIHATIDQNHERFALGATREGYSCAMSHFCCFLSLTLIKWYSRYSTSSSMARLLMPTVFDTRTKLDASNGVLGNRLLDVFFTIILTRRVLIYRRIVGLKEMRKSFWPSQA